MQLTVSPRAYNKRFYFDDPLLSDVHARLSLLWRDDDQLVICFDSDDDVDDVSRAGA